MGIMDYFGMGGGSIMDLMKKQGSPQMGLMAQLGMGGDMTTDGLPVGQLMGGSSGGNPAMAGIGQKPDMGSMLSRFGAGMSKASGPSRMPVSFGQAMAGGNDAMEAGQDKEMDTQLKQAQIGALGAKAKPDFDTQAQQIMMKKQMGLPLTPYEEAFGGTYDAFQNKMQTITTEDGVIHQVPAQRPVFGKPPAQGGGQSQRPPLTSFMR